MLKIELPEDDPVLLTNLAAALRWAGRWADAENLHYAALRESMNHAPAWVGLGQVAEDFGLWDKASRCYLNAWNLAAGPGDTVPLQIQVDKLREVPVRTPNGVALGAEVQNIALALATARMRLGHVDELTRALWAFGRFRQSWFPMPGVGFWLPGQPLPKRLLIVHEGGLGDQFWLSGYAPWGASITCPQGMAETLSAISPGVRFLGPEEELDPRDWDGQAPLQALALHALGEVRRVGGWMSHARPRVKRVGLCWTAEENGSQVKNRKIPPAELQSLQGLGVEWVNLTLSAEIPWAGPPAPGWKATHDIVAGLDLVVTCDTAVLHLAGVLGVPTLALLPRRSNWMWLTPEQNPQVDGGEGTVWYRSVELIRAQNPRGWADVVGKVKEKLCKLT